MNPAKATLLVSLVGCLAGLPARAQESSDPRQLPYQGVLERNGTLVNAPDVSFRVTVYNAREGGEVVWGPEEILASVYDGRFSLVIGSDPLNPWVHQEATPVYLDIQVKLPSDPDFVPLGGRQRLLSSPMAVAATRSDQDFHVAGQLTTDGDTSTHHLQGDSATLSGALTVGSVDSGNLQVNGNLAVGAALAGKQFAVRLSPYTHVHCIYVQSEGDEAGLAITENASPTHPGNIVPLYVDAWKWVPENTFGGNHSPGNYSAYFKGSAISAGWHSNSDGRLKEVLADHNPSKSLEKLLHLKVREFTWKNEFADHIGKVAGRREVGLIAQEVQPVLPGAVSGGIPIRDGDQVLLADPLTLQPDRLVYESIGAIQALNQKLESEVESLRRENRALREEIRAIRRTLELGRTDLP